MKKILCPTDFSETADQAIAYAAKLCKKMGAQLTLLNVQSIFSLSPAEVIKGKYLATRPQRQQLEEQSYQVMQVFKITCLAEVEPSNITVSEVIAKRAKDFDLIVMGTNGADDYFQFFFGSNSYHVVKESTVPVLLIPTGSGYQDISNIVFAFDYEQEQKLPMTQLTQLANLLDANITVLQVKKHYSREAELNSSEIQRSAESVATLPNIKFDTVYSAQVSSSIHSYVLRNKADVLALCSLNHDIIKTIFHKSIIRALSSSATYPLFIFHQ